MQARFSRWESYCIAARLASEATTLHSARSRKSHLLQVHKKRLRVEKIVRERRLCLRCHLKGGVFLAPRAAAPAAAATPARAWVISRAEFSRAIARAAAAAAFRQLRTPRDHGTSRHVGASGGRKPRKPERSFAASSN